jgi:hypothetical protein
MKRHEFEQECLHLILNKLPEEFLEEFTEGDLREFMCDFLVAYAEYRNQPPLLNAAIARIIGKMIEYAGAYSKYVDDRVTAEDLRNYHEDMKADQWERRHDY